MVDHRDILLSEEVVTEPDGVRDSLLRKTGEILRQGPHREDRRAVRLVVPVEAVDSFDWLRSQRLLPKIYWSARGSDVTTAAVGTADRCFGDRNAGYDSLRAQLDRILPKSDANVRYYGGFRFDHGVTPGEEWEALGTFTFTLPRFEYLLRGDRAFLACNLLLPHDYERREQVLREIGALAFATAASAADLPTPISRSDRPDRAGWDRNVAWALKSFRSGALEKVVLARRADFGFAEPLDALALLKRLEEATANCFVFGFQFDGGAFVGATPERLFRRSGRRIWSEAVAGTRPRGATDEADSDAFQSLMESEKDQREHAIVRESIRAALRPLCEEFHIDPKASGMKLPRGWHLVSRSRGLLLEDVHGSDVMRALHPTPAVGGHPTGSGLRAIRQVEPFDRGWYAGPVGWIGSHGAEFAVALRCGLVRGHSLSLYSGAGIVEGSVPEAEWAEIEQKISDFIKVFGLESRHGG